MKDRNNLIALVVILVAVACYFVELRLQLSDHGFPEKILTVGATLLIPKSFTR